MLYSNMPKSVVPWGLIFDSMNIIPRSYINFPRRSLWARLRICLLCDSDGHTWHVFHKSCAKEWWPGQRIHGRIWQDGEDGKPRANGLVEKKRAQTTKQKPEKWDCWGNLSENHVFIMFIMFPFQACKWPDHFGTPCATRELQYQLRLQRSATCPLCRRNLNIT